MMSAKKNAKAVVLITVSIPALYVVISFLMGVCRGMAARSPSGPVFFGVKIGDQYRPDIMLDGDGSVSSYLYWIGDKYRRSDRPYAFGGVRLERNVEAKVHKIDKFYDQDMALLLVTRNTKKIIGIVVAAKCQQSEIGSVMGEIAATIQDKHKNMTLLNKLEKWQNEAMSKFVRRPALDRIAVFAGSRKLVSVDENFEVVILGARFKEVDAPIRSFKSGLEYEPNTLRRVSVAKSANFAAYDAPRFDDDYSRVSRIDMLTRWQVLPQSVEEMYEERDLRFYAVKYDIDPDAAYVYVLVIAHDYEKLIEEDELQAQIEERREQELIKFEQEQKRRKNAAAL